VSTDPRVGTQIGEYRIEKLLGRGGMSVVYLAEHVRLKRKAALKLLSPELAEDPTFRARFVGEWERLAQLDHPNIIPVFEAGEADGLLYIAMRYVRSTDLKGLIEQEGRLDPARAANIVAQTASALDAAHQQDLVHRDVKPANILIAIGSGPEGSDHVYLSDFGLTKHTQSQSGLTQTGHFMGTIDYVAPEQISGKGVDARTDQYALACVLYQCLTGRVPFPREEETAALFAHLQDAPPRPTELRPELPSAIDEVVVRAMAKQKEERYESCTAFARAARSALGLSGTATQQQVAAPRTPTVIAAPPAPPEGGHRVGVELPSAPSVEVPSAAPPAVTPPPAEAAPQAGRSRRGVLIGGIVAGVVAIGVVAALALGGGGGGDEDGGPTGAPDVEFGVGGTLVLDDFGDPTTGWEESPQNDIERFYTDEGTYRFSISDVAAENSFAISVGPGRAVDLADTYVKATVRVVDKGGAGLLNSTGVSCRQTGTSAYYTLIGVSGRWEVQRLVPDGTLSVLAQGQDVAIAPGEAENVMEVRCFDLPDGSATAIQLLVNGKLVGEAIDDAGDRIASGTAGVAVVGQPGFVTEFDDFQVSELAVTEVSAAPTG
jgi:serine/threonine-protein kinase